MVTSTRTSQKVGHKSEGRFQIGPFDSTARVETPSNLSDKKDNHSIIISNNEGFKKRIQSQLN